MGAVKLLAPVLRCLSHIQEKHLTLAEEVVRSLLVDVVYHCPLERAAEFRDDF